MDKNPPQPSLKGGSEFSYPPLGGVRGDLFLFIFLVFCALSLFAASNKFLGFYQLIKLLEFVGLYFYAKNNFSALYDLKSFWRWFIAGAVLQSAVAINQFFAQKSLGLKIFAESPLTLDINGVAKIIVNGAKIVRAYGLVPHPNLLAAILMAAIFGAVWLIIKYRESLNVFKKIDAGAIIIVLSVALFFTFSRGVTIVGFVALIAWLILVWLKNKEYQKPILSIFSLFAICYLLLAISYWPYVSARYDAGVLAGSQAVNLRYFYNQEALTMIEKNLALGTGQGNFVWALAHSSIANFEPWMAQPVHNIYLLIASETGLLGLLAFLLFLFFTIKAAWLHRGNLSVSCLLFTVYCLLLIGLFDHFLWDLQQGQILFWLMLGILASSSPRS